MPSLRRWKALLDMTGRKDRGRTILGGKRTLPKRKKKSLRSTKKTHGVESKLRFICLGGWEYDKLALGWVPKWGELGAGHGY